MAKKPKSKPYKLKIVLGKRQYRSGPTETKMKSKLSEGPAYNWAAKGNKRKPSASAKRLKKISKNLGS